MARQAGTSVVAKFGVQRRAGAALLLERALQNDLLAGRANHNPPRPPIPTPTQTGTRIIDLFLAQHNRITTADRNTNLCLTLSNAAAALSRSLSLREPAVLF